VSPVAGRTDNNFNLLRLVFALMVVAYHAVLLPAVPHWSGLHGPLSVAAQIGVQGFFVLSGYLVWASFERSPTLGLYAEKRVRRLYPGYATVIAACVVCALAASAPARADPGAVGRYFGWNLLFLNFMAPRLPGVFEFNRFTEVNGALWTLKIEVMFYAVLPLLAWLLRTSGRWRWAVVAAIYVGAELWRLGFDHLGTHGGRGMYVEISRQLPGQLSFFVTGVAFHLLDLPRARLRQAGVAGTFVLVLSLIVPAAAPLRAWALGAVAIWVAMGLPRLADGARFGDLSYGLYIVHFPIVQAMTALGVYAASATLGLVVSAIAAVCAALMLWWLVERPALRADSAYRAAPKSHAEQPLKTV
jgi:peptidoglycan/LPS O-acetylase OafA/YrhL